MDVNIPHSASLFVHCTLCAFVCVCVYVCVCGLPAEATDGKRGWLGPR